MTYLLIGFFTALNPSICSFIGDKFFTYKDFAFYLHKVKKACAHDGTPDCHGNGQEIIFYPKKINENKGHWHKFFV